MDREHMLNVISVLFGGRIAEEIFMNQMTTGASNDFERATRHGARHGHALRDVGSAGPDGLRRERGRGVPRPLDHAHVNMSEDDDAQGRRRDPQDHRQQYAVARKLLEDNRDKVERWPRRCSSWRRSTRTRSTTSWPAGRRGRRSPRNPAAASAPGSVRRGRRRGPSANSGLSDSETRTRWQRARLAHRQRPPGFAFAQPVHPVLPCCVARNSFDSRAPLVMGIVNVTPDSFSDGGRSDDARRALAHARRMRDDGAT
jgi:hypothetical protein